MPMLAAAHVARKFDDFKTCLNALAATRAPRRGARTRAVDRTVCENSFDQLKWTTLQFDLLTKMDGLRQ